VSELKYKIGDIVNLSFKPKDLGPYIITNIISDDSLFTVGNGEFINRYIVCNVKLTHNNIDAYEWEMEYNVIEIRNHRLNELGL
jgi:hypothetical protein